MGSEHLRLSFDPQSVDPRNILAKSDGLEKGGRLLRKRSGNPADMNTPSDQTKATRKANIVSTTPLNTAANQSQPNAGKGRRRGRSTIQSSDIGHPGQQQARPTSPPPRTFSIANILTIAKAKHPPSSELKTTKICPRRRPEQSEESVGETRNETVGTINDTGHSHQRATTPSSPIQTEEMEEGMVAETGPGTTVMERRLMDLMDAKFEPLVQDKRRAQELATKKQQRIAKLHRRMALIRFVLRSSDIIHFHSIHKVENFQSRVPKSELAELEAMEAELLQETGENLDTTDAYILEETLEEEEMIQFVQGSEMPVSGRMNPRNLYVIPSVNTNDRNPVPLVRHPQELRRQPIHGFPEFRPIACSTPVTDSPFPYQSGFIGTNLRQNVQFSSINSDSNFQFDVRNMKVSSHPSALRFAGPSTFHHENLSTGNGNCVRGILGPVDPALQNRDNVTSSNNRVGGDEVANREEDSSNIANGRRQCEFVISTLDWIMMS